jgi:peptide/nickel transport system substrate-binding protein
MPDGGTPEDGAGIGAGGLEDPRAPWEQDVEDPAAPRALLAVMFTDIVGSTELAATLGDRRWRELVDQHHAAIRAEITRHSGREVDTAGDAFFATFDRPLLAVECALESVRAVRRLGLRIRAGVHIGECVVSDGNVRGVTVHIGARVGAKATGGEVLVSSTARDVIGEGIKFKDRGEQTLKGIEGRWRLYEALPATEVAESDLPALLEADLPPPPRPAWKKPRVLLAAALAFAVLAAAIAYVVVGSGGLSSVPADSVAEIDAASGDILSFVGVRRRPVGLTVTPEGIWIANSIDRNITHIDREGRRDQTIPVGAGPIDVTSGGGLVWVANADGRSVSRVSPASGKEVGDRIVAGNGLSAIAYGAGALWLANAVDGTVWRIDPSSGKTTHQIPVGPGVRGLAVTRDAVWVSSEVAGTLTRLDPRTGVIVRVVPVGNGPGAVAVGAGSVWVANAYDGTVFRIDTSSGNVTDTIRVGQGPRAIAIARGHVFVANEDSGTVSMIDARTGDLVREIELVNAPMGLTTAGDRVWVSVRGGILRYKGGTLRVGTTNVLPSLDPSFAADYYIMPMVYDGLTAFKHVGGPEGNQLVPNLAEEIRPPTDDELTYSFTLRPGLTYSDGSAVRASDVRTTFERIIRNEQYGATFLGALNGFEACTSARCDLSPSIVTDDAARTVMFHLARPFADFPYVLAIPALSIVPSSAPAGDGGAMPIPGTGPYRFGRIELKRADDESFASGEVVLERNPHFKSRGLAQPDGYPDRIELTMGGEPEEHIEAVRSGRSDFTPDLFLPGLPLEEVASQLPSQIHAADQPNTIFADLNTQVPPFNDIRARRALNLAIDRGAAVRATGSSIRAEVSCQLLPENLIGYDPYCPYTKDRNASEVWTGPDIAQAKRLVAESGTGGQRVTVWTEEGDSIGARIFGAVAPTVVSALEAIGYEASLRTVPGGFDAWIEALLDKNKRQIMVVGWSTDWPGPANYFLPLTTCPETLARLGQEGLAFTRYCSPAIDRLVLQALDRQAKDPVGSAELWARVDRALTDDAALVSIYNGRGIFFVSDRVGNVQGHTTYSVLISQMWVTEPGSPSPTPGG